VISRDTSVSPFLNCMPGVRVTPTGHMNAGNARGSSVLGPPIESHLTIEELPRAGHQELANLLRVVMPSLRRSAAVSAGIGMSIAVLRTPPSVAVPLKQKRSNFGLYSASIGPDRRISSEFRALSTSAIVFSIHR